MEFFDTGNLFMWRAAERLIALFIGAISIYFGYLLFTSLREFKSDGEGKVELPGGVSIYVSRVGPGIFFALFGTAIVAFSILNPAKVNNPPAAEATPAADNFSASYVGAQSNSEVFDAERGRTLRDLDTLKQLDTALASASNGQPMLSDADLNRLRIALPHVRQMLMLSVWDGEKWGDQQDFLDWVHNGDPASPPATLTEAARQHLNLD
jgi:hypothetical protein